MNKFVDMHELLKVLDEFEILLRCSIKQVTR
jgi:hypothetical protein